MKDILMLLREVNLSFEDMQAFYAFIQNDLLDIIKKLPGLTDVTETNVVVLLSLLSVEEQVKFIEYLVSLKDVNGQVLLGEEVTSIMLKIHNVVNELDNVLRPGVITPLIANPEAPVDDVSLRRLLSFFIRHSDIFYKVLNVNNYSLTDSSCTDLVKTCLIPIQSFDVNESNLVENLYKVLTGMSHERFEKPLHTLSPIELNQFLSLIMHLVNKSGSELYLLFKDRDVFLNIFSGHFCNSSMYEIFWALNKFDLEAMSRLYSEEVFKDKAFYFEQTRLFQSFSSKFPVFSTEFLNNFAMQSVSAAASNISPVLNDMPVVVSEAVVASEAVVLNPILEEASSVISDVLVNSVSINNTTSIETSSVNEAVLQAAQDRILEANVKATLDKLANTLNTPFCSNKLNCIVKGTTYAGATGIILTDLVPFVYNGLVSIKTAIIVK